MLSKDVENYISDFFKRFEIPQGYEFHSVQKVKIDQVEAYLFRYEKYENKGLMGEHVSFLISEKDRTILGFTKMDGKYANANLLSTTETEKIARNFLKNMDSNLEKQLKNLWIEKHDEEIMVNKQKVIVTGMKYKCYRSNTNDYAWVIVGFDGSIVTFERNIKWDNVQSKRITEKYLHDNWLIDNK